MWQDRRENRWMRQRKGIIQDATQPEIIQKKYINIQMGL